MLFWVWIILQAKAGQFTPFLKELPSFSLWGDCLETLRRTLRLQVAFTLGNRRVLRSQEGEGFRKEGDSGGGETRRKKDTQKVGRKEVSRGQKNRPRKKTNSWERRFPGTFRTNVPWFCLFSLSFQWEEVQKFPGTLFLGTFFFLF